jgi:hypothetical protein
VRQTVIRAVGRNNFGAPENEIRTIVIPLRLPEETVLLDPQTGACFDNDGRLIKGFPALDKVGD